MVGACVLLHVGLYWWHIVLECFFGHAVSKSRTTQVYRRHNMHYNMHFLSVLNDFDLFFYNMTLR